MLETPVLFMVFNRPAGTARVLTRIMEAGPKNLFISADGPRLGNYEDIDRCAQVRALIENIPREIEVHRLFRDSNLGCKKSGVTALDWFFSQVERGIVLEDDCLPDPSFFSFCEAALAKYAKEERVMIVSGHNPFGAFPKKIDAVFSKYPFIWGWASWSRAWRHYTPELADWDADSMSKQVEDWFQSKHAVHFWKKAFRDTANGDEVWDYQLNYAMCRERAFALVSARKLVSNIGFGADAVHTTDANDHRQFLPVFCAPSNPMLPEDLSPDLAFERRAARELYFDPGLTLVGRAKEVLRKVRAVVRKRNAPIER